MAALGTGAPPSSTCIRTKPRDHVQAHVCAYITSNAPLRLPVSVQPRRSDFLESTLLFAGHVPPRWWGKRADRPQRAAHCVYMYSRQSDALVSWGVRVHYRM